jgi:hypothetical protein
MNQRDTAMRISSLNDQIVYHTSIKTMAYKGHALSEDKIIAINRYMENSFVQDLHRWCDGERAKRDWRPGIDKAIYSFAERNNIIVDTDISFDALKQAEYRYRTRLQTKNKSFVLPQNRQSAMYNFRF